MSIMGVVGMMVICFEMRVAEKGVARWVAYLWSTPYCLGLYMLMKLHQPQTHAQNAIEPKIEV
jgi:hypothetical protein